MAGNALTAAMFSVGKGNTGVGTKKTSLEAIDTAVQGVQDWKSGIDTKRLKLKTDTAAQIRAIEKLATDNLPVNETQAALVLKALSAAKDEAYATQQLVLNGGLKQEDLSIFNANASHSFKILADTINKWDAKQTEIIESQTGKYVKNEDGTTTFIKPTSGKLQEQLQDLSSRLGSAESTQFSFDKKGNMLTGSFKTEINKETSTRVLQKDGDGNPILSDVKVSVTDFEGGRNQMASRLYLQDEINAFTAKDGLFDLGYQKLVSEKGLLGNIIEDLRNPENRELLMPLLKLAASQVNTSPAIIVSVLSENGMIGKDGENADSVPLNSFNYADLTDAEKGEMITYRYIDTDGKVLFDTKPKYIKIVRSQNGQQVPEFTEKDRLASDRQVMTLIYSSLNKKIDRGVQLNQPREVKDKPLPTPPGTLGGLGDVNIGMFKEDGVTRLLTGFDGIKVGDEAAMASAANDIIAKGRKQFSKQFAGTDIIVKSRDVNLNLNDEISIKLNGVKTSNTGSKEENYNWLVENLDNIFKEAGKEKLPGT